MATEAHCAYCFECLSATLEKRPLLSLQEVELLWTKYNSDDDNEEPQDLADAADAAEIIDNQDRQRQLSNAQEAKDPRPAAISRLLAPSPASSSSASIHSSSSSSNPTEASSVTSKSSSRSSFFSFGRGAKNITRKSVPGEFPLFVTWNTIGKNGSRSLRGCIGTFEAQELSDGLRSYALTSALDDSRFFPVGLRELSSLECGVTLLTNFEPASDPMAWEIGKHGLRISFTYHSRRYGATYLPDVAREQGWTKEETIVSLMRKAGWNGRRDDWRKVGDLNVVTYQGLRVSIEYKQWRTWREWAETQVY